MAFQISPVDYLQMLREQYAEHRADPLSLRKAILVSMLANHICEPVFAAYADSAPQKLDGRKTETDYRSYLEGAKPELRLIRDLWEGMGLFSQGKPSKCRRPS
jgi:hypothetical protein